MTKKDAAAAGFIPPEILEPRVLPQAGMRLAEALKTLLKEKDFNSITTTEIARTAKANEALIYRYFSDKRGLLHHVLAEYLKSFLKNMKEELKGIKEPREKLAKFVFSSIYFYNNDLVFAKILLLEVRNFPGYFESDTYQIVRLYTRMTVELIEEGKKRGVFRDDIPSESLRDIVLGSIEHLFLPRIIFGHDLDLDLIAKDICGVIFRGILKPDEKTGGPQG